MFGLNFGARNESRHTPAVPRGHGISSSQCPISPYSQSGPKLGSEPFALLNTQLIGLQNISSMIEYR